MRVYVGTYGKYNAGNLAGAWLDLSDYADWDEFITAAEALHADEHDPELMYQDWEAPDWAIDEYGVSRECWEYMALDEETKQIADHLLGEPMTDLGQALDEIKSLSLYIYTGSLEDWSAEQFLECNEVPDAVVGYIDWEAVALDNILNGVAELMGPHLNPEHHTRSDYVSWLIGRV